MANRYDAIMSKLPHKYLVRKSPDVLPPPAGPSLVRVSSLEPVSEDVIAELEHQLGTTLPKDYREFLGQYGDAVFDDRSYYQDEPGLARLYGLRPTSPNDLRWEWQHKIEGMPHFFLPIGESVIDEIMAISLGRLDFGKVYVRMTDGGYWDESKGDYMGVEVFANSFDDLISGTTLTQPD